MAFEMLAAVQYGTTMSGYHRPWPIVRLAPHLNRGMSTSIGRLELKPVLARDLTYPLRSPRLIIFAPSSKGSLGGASRIPPPVVGLSLPHR